MRAYKYMTLLLAVVLFGTSCSVTRHATYAPSSVRLDLQMSDFEYLGDAEISIDYRTYIGGAIRVIDDINGQPYDGKEIRRTNLSGKSAPSQRLKGLLRRASFKVLEDYPQADYCMVVNQEKRTERLFLGNEIHCRAVIKVYKLK